jgi:hypothetical protein
LTNPDGRLALGIHPSIYVHAERQRMLDAAAQYYSEDGG